MGRKIRENLNDDEDLREEKMECVSKGDININKWIISIVEIVRV